tara:strand:+ start:40578 stop:41267 length:690 start_codon:yes stop_codon:yes gene_type:complete
MDIVELKTWAKSAKGEAIPLFHSFDLATIENRPHLVMIGGTHGDEPAGVQLAKDTLNYLKSLDNNLCAWSWTLIPCLNADGYAQNERTNGNGVDLNRNYPSSNWSPESKKPRYFPGNAPGSEPEIASLVEWTKKYPVKLFVHFHSWEPCVVCTGAPARPLAQFLANSSGYPLQDHIGYPTAGSLSQFGWSDQNIPVICTEEDDNADYKTTWDRFGPGLKKLLSTPCPYS